MPPPIGLLLPNQYFKYPIAAQVENKQVFKKTVSVIRGFLVRRNKYVLTRAVRTIYVNGKPI